MYLLEQLKPSPAVNGDRHVQVKFALSNPSRSQRALGSQGPDKHGSGTVFDIVSPLVNELCNFRY